MTRFVQILPVGVVFAAALALVGCDETRDFQWSIGVSERTATLATKVEVRVKRNSCNGNVLNSFELDWPLGEGTLPGDSTLGEGDYGLEVELASDCQVLATGCVDVSLPDDSNVNVATVDRALMPSCDTVNCEGGVCADGGTGSDCYEPGTVHTLELVDTKDDGFIDAQYGFKNVGDDEQVGLPFGGRVEGPFRVFARFVFDRCIPQTGFDAASVEFDSLGDPRNSSISPRIEITGEKSCQSKPIASDADHPSEGPFREATDTTVNWGFPGGYAWPDEGNVAVSEDVAPLLNEIGSSCGSLKSGDAVTLWFETVDTTAYVWAADRSNDNSVGPRIKFRVRNR